MAPKKMKSSQSYERFEGVVNRALNLLVLQSPLESLLSADGNKKDLSDMSRASVVLAVSAMDAYFTGVFAERIVPYIKNRKPPKKLIILLEKAGLNTTMALELLGMERPYRRIRSLMDSYLAAHTTQRFNVIDELFLAYGFKDFCYHVERSTRRTTLLRSIQILIKRRHEIAHKGDVNSHGKTQAISAGDVRKRIVNMVSFVAAADEILQKQLT